MKSGSGRAEVLTVEGEERVGVENNLRPPLFEDFVGQEKTIEKLQVMVHAAKTRGMALSHILLSGPPGLGKTTLALILGNELGKKVRVTSGPAVEKASDLAGLLTNLEEGDILFIDEIHRLPKVVEEYLYPAMEDFHIDIIIDQGPNARSVRLPLPRFTLVAATTRTGLLSPPLRTRFTLQARLDHYTVRDLRAIVERTCGLMGVEIDREGAEEIARRSRGTPRIANNLIQFVRDYALKHGGGMVTREMADGALRLLEIDENGLDALDKKILSTIAEHYKGGPVGLNTLAIAVNEDAQTLEEVYEPYLIQEGYLQRTQQGRVLTPKGFGVRG